MSCLRLCTIAVLACTATAVCAKLPALSDEAKAKAAEATARTAWSDKVSGFQLCKAQDRVAARYMSDATKAGKNVKPAATATPCADPGPFSYTPPPLEAAGAHSPPATAVGPPSSPATQAQQEGSPKK